MLEHIRNGERQTMSAYSYDVFNRIAAVGNGSDTLYYSYYPAQQLSTATWRNASGRDFNEKTYHYDTFHRLTGIRWNGVSEVGYTLNDRDERTAANFAGGANWQYGYDALGQVTEAVGPQSYEYSYDGIGNRLTATENGVFTNYTANLLNQYTLINHLQPQYDADGNMIVDGKGWVFTYNGENRLIKAENAHTQLEFAYDYMGRRFEKKVYEGMGLVKHDRFAYDEFKLIAIYDAATTQTHAFTWQPTDLDLPVSLTRDGQTYYYIVDGNKNVTGLADAAGNRVATYTYGPFGQTLTATGALAQDNPFRFSSEYHDDETGLIYYNYRYYSPELGRWTKRDPIEEEGGVNLYGFVGNNPVNKWDLWGLVVILIHGVNTNAGWFDLARQGLSDAGCPQEVIDFRWFDDAAGFGTKRKQGGQANYATNNVGDIYRTRGKNRDYMIRAINRLANVINQLNKKRNDLGSKEPITVIAHSQGSILTIGALQLGASIDNLIIVGSPLSNTDDLSNVKDQITGDTYNYWSKDDFWAGWKNGIGSDGQRLNDLSWVTNREFAPNSTVNGYRLPSKKIGHSDYLEKEYFEKIFYVDIPEAQDNLLSKDPIIDIVRRMSSGI